MLLRRRKLNFAIGSTIYSSDIKTKKLSVFEFFKTLNTPKVREKKDGLYFVLAKFSDKVRNAQNLVSYEGAVIDLDDTSTTPRKLKRLLKDYVYCLYTTHSHMQPGKGARYRVVIPYSKPANAQHHRHTIMKIMNDMGGDKEVDFSSKALSRGMYFPTVPDRKAKRNFYFEAHTDRKRKLYEPLTIADPADEWAKQQLMDEQNFLDVNDDVAEGERNDTVARFVGKQIKAGFDLESILESAQVYNDTKIHPPLERNEIKTIVNSVYNSHKNNNKDTNWGFQELESRLDNRKTFSSDFYESFMMSFAGSIKNLSTAEREMLVNKFAKKSGIARKIIKGDLRERQQANVEAKQENVQNDLELSREQIIEKYEPYIFRLSDGDWWNVNINDRYSNVTTFNVANPLALSIADTTKFLLTRGLVDTVHSDRYYPKSTKDIVQVNGKTYVNSHVGNSLRPKKGSVARMLRHFRFLIADKRERDVVLDYIAYGIQVPGGKTTWMPILKGHKGVGKSIIYSKILKPLYGPDNVKEVDPLRVIGQFNDWAYATRVVCIHELKAEGSYADQKKFSEALKTYVSEEDLPLHLKGKSQITVENTANYIGFTNYENPLNITLDERRYCCIKITALPKNDDYYKSLIKWLENNRSQMLNFFLNRDLSNFTPNRAPDTDYTQQIKNASLRWPENVITEEINRKESPLNEFEVITWGMILDMLRARSSGDDLHLLDGIQAINSAKAAKIKDALATLGFMRLDSTVSIGKVRHYLFKTPNFITVKPSLKDVNKKIKERRRIWAKEFNTEFT